MLRFLIIVIFFLANTAQAKQTIESPDRTLEMTIGAFQPNDENWESYYDSKRMLEMSFSYAIRFFSFIDIGTSVSYGQDKGVGVLPLSNLNRGTVTYQITPVELYMVLRARFSSRQWIVPYIGGGYTRFYYRQTIDDEGYTKGSVNGLHAKAGLQILLDPFDSEAAKTIYANLGVINSYLLIEGKFTQAEAGLPAIDIGGKSLRIGVMIEY